MSVKTQVSILILIIGIAILGASYWYGVRELNAKTESIKAENAALQEDVNKLSPIAANENSYNEENLRMRGEAAAITPQFVSNIQAEDEIMYDVVLEESLGMYIRYVSTPDVEYVDVLMPEREDNIGEVHDITGAVAEREALVNSENMLSADGMMLGVAASVNSGICTYDQFKNLVKKLNDDQYIKRINNVGLNFDQVTGNLSCDYTIEYYVMTGTEHIYNEPNTGVTGHGVDSIFGALTGPVFSKDGYVNNNTK